MKCPRCGQNQDRVLDSRVVDNYVRRRRECLECQFRWFTREYRESTLNRLMVENVVTRYEGDSHGR